MINHMLLQPLNLIITNIHFLLFSLLALIPTALLLLRRRSSRESLPPGPRGLPFMGNLHRLGELPHRSLQQLSFIYGPVMFLRLGSVPALVISSADIAKELFKNFDRVFAGRPSIYVPKKLTYGCCDITFSSYGEHWREIRKIAVLELLNPKRVQSFQAVREEEIAFMITSIASCGSGLVNISELSLRVTSNILCRVAFGKKYAEEGGNGVLVKSRFDDIIKDALILLGKFVLVDYFPWLSWIHKFDGLDVKLNKIFMELDIFYDVIIGEHMKTKNPVPQHEDLVDILLRLRSDSSQKIKITNDQIKAILTDMFIAGTDTAAVVIIWAMAELIKNPTLMDKAQEEVRRMFNSKDMIEEDDLSQLSYLKLVIKEALRLHPPAPLLVPRETMETCTFFGYKIPAKTRVYVNAYAILKDSKIWQNPEEFKPERFLDNPVEFKGQDFEYIPFGAGRRGCPGIDFAMPVVELVLANLLHRFKWELPPGLKRENLDMEESFGLVMQKTSCLCLLPTDVSVA